MNVVPRVGQCQRRIIFSVSQPYWLSTRNTSFGPPPSSPPKPGSLMFKYEGFLSRWPKVLSMHRTIVDGSRWCFADVKTYFGVRRALFRGDQKLQDFSVAQLETLVQMSSEGPKMAMIVVVLPMPFAFYIFALAIIFFPRLVLTRHFWSDGQRRKFFQLEVSKALANGDQLLKQLGNPRSPNDFEGKSLDSLPFDQQYLLQSLHSILLLPGSQKRLGMRRDALRQLDLQLPAVLDQFTERQLVFHNYIRRLEIGDKGEKELRQALHDYVKKTAKLDDSAYLLAPIFIHRK